MIKKLEGPKPTNYTARGRLLRSGSIAAPNTVDGQAMRNTAVNLRDTLSAIAADEQASPRERKADAQRALVYARQSATAWVTKSQAALEVVDAVAQRIASLVNRFENSLSPIAVRRIERRAAAVEKLDVHEREKQLLDAVDGHDSEMILAHALAMPDHPTPRRALAALHAPAALAEFTASARDAVRLRAAAEGLLLGIADLERLDDPWSKAHESLAQDSLAMSHDPLATVGVSPMTTIVPRTWPAELSSFAVSPPPAPPSEFPGIAV